MRTRSPMTIASADFPFWNAAQEVNPMKGGMVQRPSEIFRAWGVPAAAGSLLSICVKPGRDLQARRHGSVILGAEARMRRIAIAIDIEWPYRHHQDALSGILKVGREKGWTCELNLFVGSPEMSRCRYDGVIGRVSSTMAAWARRTRTPAVNLWINSPDRSLARVVP